MHGERTASARLNMSQYLEALFVPLTFPGKYCGQDNDKKAIWNVGDGGISRL